MTASLLQLVAIGSEDYFFIGNPQISYFKQVNMRYTNFSIERVQTFTEAHRKINLNERSIYNFKINTEYGDILRSSYLHLKLPEIYCPTGYRFKWIKNLGDMIIEEAQLIINNKIIETLDSNSIHILNNLPLNKKQTDVFNKSTCNLPEYYYPIVDNKYPNVDKIKFEDQENTKTHRKLNLNFKDVPSISELDLYIPIPFFYTRFKILNIPICALRKSNVFIKIYLRPLRELYTIGEEKNYKIGFNDLFDETVKDSLMSSIDEYIPYSYKNLEKKSIIDFIKDKNSLNDINISIYNYTIFLDKAERFNFSNNKYSALITIPKYFKFLGKSNEVELKIENNDLVKEMFIFGQRDDIELVNNWSNYSIYDFNETYINRKLYQNYYLKLSLEQYKKDISDFNIINESYRELKNKIFNDNKSYDILIRYIDIDNNINTLSFMNIVFNENLDSLIKFYFDLLNGIVPETHSFLIYYGMFRKNANDEDTIILQQYFRYKILNSKNEDLSIDSLKYLPLFTIENSFIKLDFTNPRHTTSLLKDSITYIRPEKAVKDTDIKNLLEIWGFRDLYKIPYIDDLNIDYFDKPNIIKSILVKADGNPINNIQDDVYASYGKNFEIYKNCNIKNLVYYPFTEYPLKYQPSGHLNFDLINNFDINLLLKHHLVDTLDYKFNIFVYIMVYKILNIEKDNVSLLL